ncbi:MAG: ATP-binding protein [Bacteroidia bacterium]|nr:ATP-binding protein [Bacteroidia bacterium]
MLRGLPGSGKSTLAAVLCEENKYPVFSIDSFFINTKTGEYKFEFDKNHLAYKNCEEQTRNAMKNNCEKIFIDNTFTLEWEMEPYFKLAKEFDFALFVVTVENRHGGKNSHDVSDDQLKKMAEKYQVKLFA